MFNKFFFIIPILFILIISSQYLNDRFVTAANVLPPFVAPSEVVRFIDFGMHSAAASYLWLSAIQNLSLSKLSNRGSIEDFVYSINKLDPKFAHPYAFAALVFPELGLIDEGIEAGFRGMKSVPDDWEIPYYTAQTYHIQKDDRTTAAKLFDRVAQLSSAPENIKKVALNYGSSTDKRQQSRLIWESIYETTDDKIVAERAQNYVLHYEILDILDEATAIFKKRYGKNPAKVEDLVTTKIIKAVPEDPLGLGFEYDESGKVVAR